MSLFDLVAADDLAVLAIRWVLLCTAFVWLWLRASRRWDRYIEHKRREHGAPDPRVHRAGSVEDFRGRVARNRWP